MIKNIVKGVLFVGCLFMFSCSTVTISPHGKPKTSVDPTHEFRQDFFLFGLIGEREVNVKQHCGGDSIQQVQTQDKFLDSLLRGITFGIYMPRTVRVWCGS